MKSALLPVAPLLMASALAGEPTPTDRTLNEEKAKVALFEKLPAVGKGDQIAFFATRGEYDDTGRTELRIATPGAPLRQWPFEESRFDKTRTTLRTRVFPKGLQRARRLFMADGFQSLAQAVECKRQEDPNAPPLPSICRCETIPEGDNILPIAAGPWLVSYNTAQNELRVHDADCKVVLRRKATIPKGWYCCGGAEPSDPGCDAPWDRMTVWWDKRVLVVEGGSIAGPDGCELEHVYFVAWPTLGKSSVTENWNPMRARRRK